MDDSEALAWVAGGFAAMIVGIFTIMYHPLGVVMCLVGVVAFSFGYYNFNPFRGMTFTHWWVAVGLFVFIMVGAAVAWQYLR